MSDILTPQISAGDLMIATRGYCTSTVQRNWVARGIPQLAPLEAPRAGKPRMYSLLSVYEFAILAEGVRQGVSLDIMRRAMGWRKMQVTAAGGGDGGFVEESFVKGVEKGALEEFNRRDLAAPAYWVIALRSEGEEGKQDFEAMLPAGRDGLQEAIARFDEGRVMLCMTLNITAIVCSVHQALEQAGVNYEAV